MTSTPIIQWRYPAPQNALDQFIGPGTTLAEALLQTVTAALAAVALLIHAHQQNLGWTLLQTLVALLLVVDMVGGIITNASNPAKRWYHRPEQTTSQHVGFVALHIIQLLLYMIFFRPSDGGFVVLTYGYLLLATALLVRAPLYLQRPLALALWLGAFWLNTYVLLPTPGLEWFLPLFYLKLLVCHLVREEPYRPTWNS
jgi:hypothetical protein